MRRQLMILLLVLLPLSSASAFDFSLYNQLLQKYVKVDGKKKGLQVNLVNYPKWHREQKGKNSQWNKLLAKLAKYDTSRLKTKNQKLAFWGNVYNIAAIKTVLDKWPVKSIRSTKIHWRKSPWKTKIITVGGKKLSLHQIEFDKLINGLNDIRGHLAVNCASTSCVDVGNRAFTAKNIDAELQKSGERFFSQRGKGMTINKKKKVVYISQIFKFDKKNFKRMAGGPIKFIMKYVKNPSDRKFLKSGRYKIKYLNYDWSLNGPVK